jgi:hypothetical protein
MALTRAVEAFAEECTVRGLDVEGLWQPQLHECGNEPPHGTPPPGPRGLCGAERAEHETWRLHVWGDAAASRPVEPTPAIADAAPARASVQHVQVVQGSYIAAVARVALEARLPAAQACYAQALAFQKDLRGTVGLTFLIDRLGGIYLRAVRPDGDLLSMYNRSSCFHDALDAIETVKLEPPVVGIVQVEATFLFEPAELTALASRTPAAGARR